MVAVRILGTDGVLPLPPDQVGKLAVKGAVAPNTSTQEGLASGEWHATNIDATLDEDGFLSQ